MNEIGEIVKQIFLDGMDGITFLPINDDGDLDIKGFTYTKKSKYQVSKHGNYYHILIYKISDEGKIVHLDNTISILMDPYVYVTHLIRCGFFGIVTKQTKTNKSKQFVNNLYKNLKSL